MKRIICVLGLLLLLVGCSPKNNQEPIRIGVNDWPPCEVWYIAEEQGYFGDQPVEIVRFTTWTDNMSSLYLGKIDITHSTYFNTVNFFNKGERGQMIAPIDFIEGSDGFVVKENLDQFKESSMKVAVEVGTDEHFLMFKTFDALNIAVEDVEIVSSTSRKAMELFANGEVDGAFTYEPFLSKAAQEGEGEIIYTTADMPGYMVDVLVAVEGDVTEQQEGYETVMKAWYKALDYIKENPDEAYEQMAQNENMDVEAFKPFFESFHFFDLDQAHQLTDSTATLDYMDEMRTFIIDNKLGEDTESIDKMIRIDVLEALKKD